MEYIKINNFKLYTSKDYEGGGLTYGIPALSSKNIFPHIVNGDIFEICCGVGTMGFYLNSLNKCNSLTLSDINPKVEKYIEATIKDNNFNNTNFFISDGLDNIPSSKKFDTVVLNPPHYRYLEDRMKEFLIGFDSYDLKFHKNFYNNIHKYIKSTSSIIHIGCYIGEGAILPSDILNIVKDRFEIHFIEYSNYTNQHINIQRRQVDLEGNTQTFSELAKFYTMVLKPNLNHDPKTKWNFYNS
jgi:methylase of polypeptide subunit release factors